MVGLLKTEIITSTEKVENGGFIGGLDLTTSTEKAEHGGLIEGL